MQFLRWITWIKVESSRLEFKRIFKNKKPLKIFFLCSSEKKTNFKN